MTTVWILDVPFTCEDDDWWQMLSRMTSKAFELAGIDYDENEDLFYDTEDYDMDRLMLEGVKKAISSFEDAGVHDVIAKCAEIAKEEAGRSKE